MEHHLTWLEWLAEHSGSLGAALRRLAGWPFNTEGLTWLNGDKAELVHVFSAAVVVAGLFLMGVSARRYFERRKSDLAPEARVSVASFVEIIVERTLGMLSNIMGKQAAPYFLPLIGATFFFILLSNLLGLVPGFLPPTDKLNTTLACAVVIFFVTQFYGLKVNGKEHLKHFFGPIRGLAYAPIMLMMFAIETFSHIVIRPGSLALRLAANMTADHLVLGLFHGLNDFTAFLLPLPIYALGVIVCVVQALVFCLLSAVYIGMAIEVHGHGEHHEAH